MGRYRSGGTRDCTDDYVRLDVRWCKRKGYLWPGWSGIRLAGKEEWPAVFVLCGSLRRACKMMYCTLGYEPARKRLTELANIDAARTKGRRRDQESGAKLLKTSVSSIKVDKNQGIQ